MKRLHTINSTLAVLTLAAIAIPASAQYNSNYRPTYGGNLNRLGSFGSFGNTVYGFNYGQPYYGQFGSGVIFQGGSNFPSYGWNQNTIVNPDGSIDLPSGAEVYGANGNFRRIEDDAEGNTARNRSNALPRSSDAIQVSKTSKQVSFGWQGDSDSVRRITFSLLDRAKQPLRQQIITNLPAEARLTRNSRSVYYRVIVEYINGTTNTVLAPL